MITLEEFNERIGRLMFDNTFEPSFSMFLGVDYDVGTKTKAVGYNLKSYWLEWNGKVTWYFCNEAMLKRWLDIGEYK